MPMAEPADCGLAYLSQFPALHDVWAAHADGRHKFHGILDRVEAAGSRSPAGHDPLRVDPSRRRRVSE